MALIRKSVTSLCTVLRACLSGRRQANAPMSESIPSRAVRWLIGTVLLLGALAGCAPQDPPRYDTSKIEQALSGKVYRGEWYDGLLYEIAFVGVGANMEATVRVIDSDNARTEYNMPARVMVSGNEVTLTFTQIDRIDYLKFDPEAQRLEGSTRFRGKLRERNLWAVLVRG